MWTTSPPAKSLAPIAPIQPPPHTMWARGPYTISTQSVMKARYGPNFMRSAKAPIIRAGVLIATIAWNLTKRYSGMP
jgi:hypothetical protein